MAASSACFSPRVRQSLTPSYFSPGCSWRSTTTPAVNAKVGDPLQKAIAAVPEDMQRLRDLILQDPDIVIGPLDNGYTPVTWAIRHCRTRAFLQILISAGADLGEDCHDCDALKTAVFRYVPKRSAQPMIGGLCFSFPATGLIYQQLDPAVQGELIKTIVYLLGAGAEIADKGINGIASSHNQNAVRCCREWQDSVNATVLRREVHQGKFDTYFENIANFLWMK